MISIPPNKYHSEGVTGKYIHYVLIRTLLFSIDNWDYRNIVYTLRACNIPSMNSLDSIILCQEKICKYGALRAIRDREGKDRFPLID